MLSMIITVALGIFLCALGAMNMRGNISAIHSYHRNRVREEDKKPFGRLVGIGNIIIGISLAIFGVLTYVFERTQNTVYTIVGCVVIGVGLVVGLGLSFFAMVKYNKGIF